MANDPRCTTAALTAVFGHYPGVLAAYCNDFYLVVHSSGLAAHPTSLSSIFTPPGGGTCLSGAATFGYGDQCVTRDYASAYAVYKLPLVPTLLSTASGTVNNAQFTFTSPQSATNAGVADVNNLLYFNGQTSLPTRGEVAISVSCVCFAPRSPAPCARRTEYLPRTQRAKHVSMHGACLRIVTQRCHWLTTFCIARRTTMAASRGRRARRTCATDTPAKALTITTTVTHSGRSVCTAARTIAA